MLPKLTVKTASSDNAPSISKSFVALPPPAAAPAVVNGNADAAAQSLQPGTALTTVDGASEDPETYTSPPPPPPPRRLPSPPAAADRATADRPRSRQPDWQVVSATLNSPRHRRPRPAAAARLRRLDDDRGSGVRARPTASSSTAAADWLRLIEKLGDTQFGEVSIRFTANSHRPTPLTHVIRIPHVSSWPHRTC